jgi:hypothetical protein
MVIDVRAFRAVWKKARTLRLKERRAGKPDEALQLEDVRRRMRDLALILESLYRIYRDDRDGLYGDDFLAFVGNSVIREWPGKDFPFYSENAAAVAAEHGIRLSAGMTDLPEGLRKKLHPEHWTPISFFRDVFHLAREQDILLERDHFYELLFHYYRVVWITKGEEKDLDKRHRTARQLDTYADLGIVIEHALWGK